MKISSITLLILALTYFPANAQKCYTSEKILESMAANPEVAKRVAEIEAFTIEYERNNSRSAQKTTVMQRVPIVVHILYKTATENITDAQVLSQFDVLYHVFNNYNINNAHIPPAFEPLAATAEIDFCLAKVAPDGKPTNGIIRKAVPNSFEGVDDYYNPSKGGVAPWDPERYLNVYLVRLNTTHLGFAYKPGTAPEGQEAVVIDYRAWGNIEVASGNPPYNLGMTAVHEFGHYFNLDHPWGVHGGCGSDDGIADTPPQDGPTWGCPTFPTYDPCSPSGDGIMFMNFMDYNNDICSKLFTHGQKLRMKAAIAGPRSKLASSLACNPVSVPSVTTADFSIVPNPARDYVQVRLSQTEPYSVELFNSTGQLVLSNTSESGLLSINITELASGWYFVRVSNDISVGTKKLFVAQ